MATFKKEDGAHLSYWLRLQILERAEFAYLPEESWMRKMGYIEQATGLYHHQGFDHTIRRVRMLSQTNMVLLYVKEKFIDARVIGSDQELFRFLAEHAFPVLE
jgi:hypothetical protein